MFSRDTKVAKDYTPEEMETSPPKPAETPKPVSNNGAPSIISADLVITGELRSKGDLQIDGQVEGNVTSRTLTIGPSGDVNGMITAQTLRISGKVDGQVFADSVFLLKTAKVTSDITQKSLTMESGAILEGKISRAENSVDIDTADVTPLRPSNVESKSA
jgi:cytoskeletal protein CcmA (bactofilin family)